MLPCIPCFLLSLILFATVVNAIAANRTIDDRFGDSVTGELPTFEPDWLWSQNIETNNGDKTAQELGWDPDKGIGCGEAGCSSLIAPYKLRAFRGTWSEERYSDILDETLIVTLRFNGTAIYVYLLLPEAYMQDGENVRAVGACKFGLDQEDWVKFTDNPEPESDRLIYGEAVYVRENLPNGPHTLRIQADSEFGDYINFDYAEYTTEEDPDEDEDEDSEDSTESTSKPSIPTGAIIGAAVGGAAFLAALAFLLYFFVLRKKKEDPYHPDSESHWKYGAVGTHDVDLSDRTLSANPQQDNLGNFHPPGNPLPEPQLAMHPRQRDLRKSRQEAIDRQLRTVQQVMANLDREIKGEEAAARSLEIPGDINQVGNSGEGAIELMREQMRRLEEEIRILRENQTSDWAAGLTDDPPPGYSLVAGDSSRVTEDQVASMHRSNSSTKPYK